MAADRRPAFGGGGDIVTGTGLGARSLSRDDRLEPGPPAARSGAQGGVAFAFRIRKASGTASAATIAIR